MLLTKVCFPSAGRAQESAHSLRWVLFTQSGTYMQIGIEIMGLERGGLEKVHK